MAQVKTKKAAAPAETAGAATRTKVAKSASADALDPSVEWSLDEVERHLPEVAPEEVALLRELLLGAHSQREFVDLGTQFRTEDIIAAAPPFLIGCLAAIKSLGTAPPGLGLGYFPLLLAETRELRRLNTQYEQELRNVAAVISGRRAQLKLANSKALDARRAIAQTLLRSVIPMNSKYRAELESAAAGTDSYAGTIASVRTVIRIVTELRQDPKIARGLDSLQYDAAYVDGLAAQADEVEELSKLASQLTPPQLTNQTALDVQDGIVCAVMRAMWAPLRDAKRNGAALDLPPVGALQRMFISRPRSDRDEDDVTPPAAG